MGYFIHGFVASLSFAACLFFHPEWYGVPDLWDPGAQRGALPPPHPEAAASPPAAAAAAADDEPVLHRPGGDEWGWPIDDASWLVEGGIGEPARADAAPPSPPQPAAAAEQPKPPTYLWVHCAALLSAGFGDKLQGLYAALALAKELRRTLVLPPFAFKELNYALFQRRTAGLPTEAGRRARWAELLETAGKDDERRRYLPATRWLDAGALRAAGYDAIEFDEWAAATGGVVELALVSANATICGDQHPRWGELCAAYHRERTATHRAALRDACDGERAGARAVVRYGRRVLLRDVRFLHDADSALLRGTGRVRAHTPLAAAAAFVREAAAAVDAGKPPPRTLSLDGFCSYHHALCPNAPTELGAALWESSFKCYDRATLAEIDERLGADGAAAAPPPTLVLADTKGVLAVGQKARGTLILGSGLPTNRHAGDVHAMGRLQAWHRHNNMEPSIPGLWSLVRELKPSLTVLAAVDPKRARVGDFVMAVDGVDVAGLPFEELAATLRQTPPPVTLTLQRPEHLHALHCRAFWEVRRAVRFSPALLQAAAAREERAAAAAAAAASSAAAASAPPLLRPFAAVHWRHGDVAIREGAFASAERLVAALAKAMAGAAPRMKGPKGEKLKKLRAIFLLTDNFLQDEVSAFKRLAREKLGLRVFGAEAEDGEGEDDGGWVARAGSDMALAAQADAFFYSRESSYFTRLIREERALLRHDDTTAVQIGTIGQPRARKASHA